MGRGNGGCQESRVPWRHPTDAVTRLASHMMVVPHGSMDQAADSTTIHCDVTAGLVGGTGSAC